MFVNRLKISFKFWIVYPFSCTTFTIYNKIWNLNYIWKSVFKRIIVNSFEKKKTSFLGLEEPWAHGLAGATRQVSVAPASAPQRKLCSAGWVRLGARAGWWRGAPPPVGGPASFPQCKLCIAGSLPVGEPRARCLPGAAVMADRPAVRGKHFWTRGATLNMYGPCAG